MTQPTQPMTTKEFAEATGIPTATISKLIRDRKIEAKKEGKAWMIPRSQLESDPVRKFRQASKSTRQQKLPKAADKIEPAEAPEAEAVEPKFPVQAAPTGPTAPDENESAAACEPTPPEKSYSIPEFAAMTYLTERGVSEWLVIGRLRGCKTETGEWRVLDINLKVSDIIRLVRK